MILESVEHGTISKALKRLKFYLDNPHSWYWQRPWDELSQQQQIDIVEEFALHDDYASCGVWKSEKHRRNEEKRFLYNTTRLVERLPIKMESRADHTPIGLDWLLDSDLPSGISFVIYLYSWSRGRKPRATFKSTVCWAKQLKLATLLVV